MKHRKLISLILMTLMVFSLAACGPTPDPDPEPVPNPDEQITEAAVVVDYFHEDGDTSDFIMYEDTQYSEDELTGFYMQTDQTITDIKLVSVDIGYVTEEMTTYFVKDVIYELSELTDKDTLVFKIYLPNMMANYALTYVDTTGEEKIYSIAQSGEDGSVILSPAVFEDGEKPAESANVVMTFATDDEIAEYSERYEFTDPAYDGSIDYMSILLTTDATINNFKIYDAEIGTVTDSTTGFRVIAEIYEQAEINAGVPFVYRIVFPGDVPTRVVSYEDADGEMKAFSLSTSGKDGSLVVAPGYIED